MTRRHRGSRAVRGGPTRSSAKWITAVLAEPLPTDPAEAYVARAVRAWAVAQSKDQRSTGNRRRTDQAWNTAERVTADHLNRVHGAGITRSRYGSYDLPDGKYANVWKMHTDAHEGAE